VDEAPKKKKKALFRSINPSDHAAEEMARSQPVVFTDREGTEGWEDAAIGYDTYDAFREDYGVAGSTLREVSIDYSFPLEFLVNSAVQLGLSPPVDCDRKLSLMLNGEQIFAMVEALTTLDPAEAYDRFVDFSLEDIADDFEVELARVFELCGDLGLSLPMGVRSHLLSDEYDQLAEELELETGVDCKRSARFRDRESRPNLTVEDFERNGFGGFHEFNI